jgi:hypothetical protein
MVVITEIIIYFITVASSCSTLFSAVTVVLFLFNIIDDDEILIREVGFNGARSEMSR